MLRICRQCNVHYEGSPGSSLCPECVAKNRKNVIRDRTCRGCGITFPGGPRAWYCLDCRAERQRQQQRDYQRQGPARPLGSADLCEICGGEYIVTSGRQRYCPTCAVDATKAADRRQGIQWYADNGDPDRRRELRQAHAAQIPCKVCGKMFMPCDSSLTCSTDCSNQLHREAAQRYEREHRDQRNAQRRKYYQKKKEKNSEKD